MTVLASPCLIIKRDAPRIYSVIFLNELTKLYPNQPFHCCRSSSTQYSTLVTDVKWNWGFLKTEMSIIVLKIYNDLDFAVVQRWRFSV